MSMKVAMALSLALDLDLGLGLFWVVPCAMLHCQSRSSLSAAMAVINQTAPKNTRPLTITHHPNLPVSPCLPTFPTYLSRIAITTDNGNDTRRFRVFIAFVTKKTQKIRIQSVRCGRES